MGVKTATAKDAIRQEKATAAKLQITLRASKKRLPLDARLARKVRTRAAASDGVCPINLGAWRPRRKVLAHAFIAKMPTGHVGVFTRIGSFGRRARPEAGKDRRAVYGASIGHVFEKYQEQAIDRMRDTFEARLAHELQFEKDGGA
jgi:hypothetical protein